MDLQQKVALVTGGTMGLGQAMAIDLARNGADVAIAARNLGDTATAVADQIAALNRKCHLIQADLAQGDECGRCVEAAVSHFGRLDVLISNAGGPSPGTIEEVTPDQWMEAMAVHVNANYFLVRAALPHLRKQSEAAIVTVSSAAGIRGCPGAIAYCTAKGAVTQFTRALARDVADDNIRVNCVAPGVIRTRFHEDMTPERQRFNIENRIPLHREGTCEEVAQVVTLLVTNGYITGETYCVDGGLTMRIV